jgi:cathepsin E
MITNRGKSCVGTEFNDQVDFGSGLVIHGQSIGAATDSQGFDDSDGILGFVSTPWQRHASR